MLSAQDNETLVRTGPGTPMGDVIRSYWQPALLARELPAPNCPPVRLKLLGEEFLAFRDGDGQVGVVEPRCPHRGADLFFGRPEHGGLRCVYHGWKFDSAGACVDTPTLPPEQGEQMRPRAAIRALQSAEFGDLIWVWMGEGEAPALPQFEFATLPPEHRFVSKKLQQCNWAQACEGGLDTAHFSWLHAGVRDDERVSLLEGGGRYTPPAGQNEPANVARFRWMIQDSQPQFSVLEHAAGLLLCAARASDDAQRYWRCTQFLMPNHSLAPGNFPEDNNLGNTWVPIDDHACWIYCYCWNPDRPLSEDEVRRLAGGSGIFAEVDEHYVPLRRRENDYLIDRELQRTENFTGITGISEQDQAIADSQGLIADRTRELLGQTDLGVVRFRRTVLQAARDVADGRTPLGADRPEAYHVRSGDTMAPPDVLLTDALEARFGAMRGVELAPG